jgi:hypothetical protein
MTPVRQMVVACLALSLAGCGAAPTERPTAPPTASVVPAGSYACLRFDALQGLVDDGQLVLASDGTLTEELAASGQTARHGRWLFSQESYTIGFSGDLTVDYAYFDPSADRLFVNSGPASGTPIQYVCRLR